MRAILLLSILLLTGCPGTVKPVPPAAQVIEKPVPTYVPIPEKLTKRCQWPKKGKPSEAIEVARKRRECLEQYEGQLGGIEQVQGNAVP